MRLRPFIVILPILWWGGVVRAQVPEEPSSIPEQWQLTLDVIKSKAQDLVIENNGLQDEYRKLVDRAQELQQAIDNQRNKNDQKERFLKERHGETDQQARIESLTQDIKTDKEQAGAYEEQLANLRKQQSEIDKKDQLLRYAIRTAELNQQGASQQDVLPQDAYGPAVDSQLTRLRKQLEDESTQEVLLENAWGALKTGDKTQNADAQTIEAENKQLETRLSILRLQRLQNEKKPSDGHLSQANARRYDQIKIQKGRLEAQIYAYESRMDELSQNSLTALSWPMKKKNLIHKLVLVDARNNQMRDQIKQLQEDIDVLRDQVGKLERRVDFAQGKTIP